VKFVAYLFAAVVFVSAMIMPAVELLSAFTDLCKIDAAVHTSIRAAIKEAEDEQQTRDVNSVIKHERFKEIFEDSFCSALNLRKTAGSNFISQDGQYNDFTVEYTDIDKEDTCTVEVKTPYKFKTGLFKRYLKDLNSAGVLRVKKTETFIIEN
jgi:hypothetical protein